MTPASFVEKRCLLVSLLAPSPSSIFIQERLNQLWSNVKRRFLESGQSGRQVKQIELRGSAQNAERANER